MCINEGKHRFKAIYLAYMRYSTAAKLLQSICAKSALVLYRLDLNPGVYAKPWFGLYNRPPSINVPMAVKKRQNSLQHILREWAWFVRGTYTYNPIKWKCYFLAEKVCRCPFDAYNLNYLNNGKEEKENIQEYFYIVFIEKKIMFIVISFGAGMDTSWRFTSEWCQNLLWRYKKR